VPVVELIAQSDGAPRPLSEMRECRGVGRDDWPMVYRAFLR
jgi:hypothetical protein